MIDFHCHLDLFTDPRAIVRRADDRDLSLVSVTTTPLAWEGSVSVAKGSARVATAIGIHPELAHTPYAVLERFEAALRSTSIVGEVGLDGSRELRLHRSAQMSVFRSILRMCSLGGGKLLSIHSRGAATRVLDCLEEAPGCGVPILHWFSGSPSELDRAIRMGCWFSVGPAMLSGAKGRRVLEAMPRDRIVCETDSPVARHSGEPLAPWDISRLVPLLAGSWLSSEAAAKHQIEINEAEVLRRATGSRWLPGADAGVRG